MPITTDFHCHVSYTSATAMVQAARDKGLRTLGISEHVFQMEEGRVLLQHMPQEGPFLTFATYLEGVQAAAQELQFDVRLGLEVDFIPGKNSAIQEIIHDYPWDYLIGSIHEISGLLFENQGIWTREQGEQAWLHYFALLREAATSGYFSVISHPVRMRRANVHIPPAFDEELERLAAEAARCDVALEINGYDTLTYPGMVHHLAKACALHHTPISVGSDAHRPKELMRAHAQTESLLREVGIHTIRTWKQRKISEYTI